MNLIFLFLETTTFKRAQPLPLKNFGHPQHFLCTWEGGVEWGDSVWRMTELRKSRSHNWFKWFSRISSAKSPFLDVLGTWIFRVNLGWARRSINQGLKVLYSQSTGFLHGCAVKFILPSEHPHSPFVFWAPLVFTVHVCKTESDL